ncbi:MAG: allophanate hydrolase [Bifidobacterium tibiigranuli]|jgi:allophanate hydrolase|nr:allophanate hydrolase [Bifidobacterium tibiigranuli]MCI1797727.1 allophanate hydrolase [Bifidobacterium tibiigranuli]
MNKRTIDDIRAKAYSYYAKIIEERQTTGTEIWISVTTKERLDTELERIEKLNHDNIDMPLWGLFFAVKDNIDVCGFSTTAAHPDFAYEPVVSAQIVQDLENAGAVVLGKTNMDQFATGLTGSRSPYGPVHSATKHDRISGGSSSGSAVSVAKDEVDFSLGTDTAGSGRVPAMFNGIFGFKPTIGITKLAGVVPACESFDCVSVFSKDYSIGSAVHKLMMLQNYRHHNRLGQQSSSPSTRTKRIAIPDDSAVNDLTPSFRSLFDQACAKAEDAGYAVEPVDMTDFFEAGSLLYEGALVAERFAAVGEFVETHHEHCDPSVEHIVLGAKQKSAYQYVRDWDALHRTRKKLASFFQRYEGLLVPTASMHPLMSEVAANPIGVNSALGKFTTFVNLLDMAGVAFPVGESDDGMFGATFLVPAMLDMHAVSVVSEIIGLPIGPIAPDRDSQDFPLLVFGAHRAGGRLNPQLTDLGAQFLEETKTSNRYAMSTVPGTNYPRVRCIEEDNPESSGSCITGELWSMPSASFTAFAHLVREPLSIGPVELDDGRNVLGFLCSSLSTAGEESITGCHDWMAYRHQHQTSAIQEIGEKRGNNVQEA